LFFKGTITFNYYYCYNSKNKYKNPQQSIPQPTILLAIRKIVADLYGQNKKKEANIFRKNPGPVLVKFRKESGACHAWQGERQQRCQ